MNRRAIQWGVIALAVALVATTGWRVQDQQEQRLSSDPPFDFYVLALSWSPAFCASDAGQGSPMQCGAGADFGFITHGLWPQFERGWPSFCQSPHGQNMPQDTVAALLPIMPDRGLIEHQWDKHGTCSGLSQERYAERIEAATIGISVPSLFDGPTPDTLDASTIEHAFQQANPDLSQDGIAIACPGGRFMEVRICLDQNLGPRSCQEVDRQGCRQAELRIAPR